jgi:hypothetical protein
VPGTLVVVEVAVAAVVNDLSLSESWFILRMNISLTQQKE